MSSEALLISLNLRNTLETSPLTFITSSFALLPFELSFTDPLSCQYPCYQSRHLLRLMLRPVSHLIGRLYLMMRITFASLFRLALTSSNWQRVCFASPCPRTRQLFWPLNEFRILSCGRSMRGEAVIRYLRSLFETDPSNRSWVSNGQCMCLWLWDVVFWTDK